VLAIAAPHSIAATQIAWVCGLLLWAVRCVVRPRRHWRRTPLDYALLGFFILTVISSLASYDPENSTGKLRAASLFTIVYLVAQNVFSRRVARLLALVLIGSCMINVVYTLGERAVGRGVKVQGLKTESPLYVAGIRDGDTLLEVDGRKLRSPEELVAALDTSGDAALGGAARVRLYRFEWMPTFDVQRGRLLDGATAPERLGIGGWSRGRDWRASGFFGHYTTYAEALQLITSLAFAFFIILPNKRSLGGALLLVAVMGLGLALLLTVTRASWLAFLLSAFVIVALGASRRTLFILTACALPLVFAGLFVLQQKRNVGFFDPKDDSIRWRETVQREGFELLLSKPRHLLVGVGMDSIKRYWRQWGLFDNGRLPIGHMHSTYLQLALERGVPALLMWLALVFMYARMLWRLVRRGGVEDWIERGIALGALGGLVGFLASGLVHYNLGDSEVAMVFYLIMGLTLVVERETRKERHA
jgi:O-antigen ligase